MGKLFTRDTNILDTNPAFGDKSTNRKVGIEDSNKIWIADLINFKEYNPSHIIKDISKIVFLKIMKMDTPSSNIDLLE